MGRDDADVMEFGGSRVNGWLMRRWQRWLLFALAVLVTATAAVHAMRASGPTTTPATRPSIAKPLLGVKSRWELFGRGPAGVIRVEFADGLVTHTAIPPLASTGPVSFVVGPDFAIVRPLDVVPGYIVPDGRPAHALAADLARGGVALPGPDPADLWVPAGSRGRETMTLVDADGRPTGASIVIPAGMRVDGQPDGSGYLLLRGSGGVYLARPDGLRRITTGALLAVGVNRWLTAECDAAGDCATVVIDRGTGARRVLNTAEPQTGYQPGTISPDGAIAAIRQTDPTGVHLLDLATGADRRLDVLVDPTSGGATMVWSPDSRWLFIAGAGGTLYVIDVATARVRNLGVALPPISQLAVRQAPASPFAAGRPRWPCASIC